MKWKLCDSGQAEQHRWRLTSDDYDVFYGAVYLQDNEVLLQDTDEFDRVEQHSIEEAKAFIEYAVAYNRVSNEWPTLGQWDNYYLLTKEQQNGSIKIDESTCTTGS